MPEPSYMDDHDIRCNLIQDAMKIAEKNSPVETILFIAQKLYDFVTAGDSVA